jgi:CRISPR-associated protein Cas8b1/Cst1 subtype I-B
LFCLDSSDRECVLHEKISKAGYVHFLKSRSNDPRFKEVSKLFCSKEERTLIVTYIGYLEELKALKKEIESIYSNQVYIHFMKDNYIKDHYFLEITHSNANKKDGLSLWTKLMGCNEKDVTVFGDNLNDIGMFVNAGRRVAVKNAHQQLINMSDQVIDSNEEDGVAKYIMEFV